MDRSLLLAPAVLALPVMAAAVVPRGALAFKPPAPPSTTTPDPLDDPSQYRSEALRNAVASLQTSGFLGRSLSTITRCDAAIRSIINSPWIRNPVYPAAPLLTHDQALAAGNAMLSAFEAGATSRLDETGAFQLISSGATLWMNQLTALGHLKRGGRWQDLPFTPTRLAIKAAQVYRARREIVEYKTTLNTLLGSFWFDIADLAITMDDVGAPLAGDPTGITLTEALKQRWDGVEDAAGRLALGVGNAVAGVAGDAAWRLIASPLGVVLLGVGLWMLMPQRGATT